MPWQYPRGNDKGGEVCLKIYLYSQMGQGRKAVEHGFRIYPKHKIAVAPDPFGMIHNSREGVGQLYRRKVRSLDTKKFGEPLIHGSVHKRKDYKPWILIA